MAGSEKWSEIEYPAEPPYDLIHSDEENVISTPSETGIVKEAGLMFAEMMGGWVLAAGGLGIIGLEVKNFLQHTAFERGVTGAAGAASLVVAGVLANRAWNHFSNLVNFLDYDPYENLDNRGEV